EGAAGTASGQRGRAQDDAATVAERADLDVETAEIECRAGIHAHRRGLAAECVDRSCAQRATVERRAARVGVGAAQQQNTVTFLDQSTHADSRAAHTQGRTALGNIDPAATVV